MISDGSAKIRCVLGFKSYVDFYRGSYSPVSEPRSWALSCRSRITVPLEKLEKKESQDFPGFLQLAGKRNLASKVTYDMNVVSQSCVVI